MNNTDLNRKAATAIFNTLRDAGTDTALECNIGDAFDLREAPDCIVGFDATVRDLNEVVVRFNGLVVRLTVTVELVRT